MTSVGALLMFLPVAWTCSPQKAGNITFVQRVAGAYALVPYYPAVLFNDSVHLTDFYLLHDIAAVRSVDSGN